jgi:hypothetical protein
LEVLESRVVLSGSWTTLANNAPGDVGTMMLLSDGTVLAQQGGVGTAAVTNTWYQLVPQGFTGSYVNGTWNTRASMNLQRLWYASNVLPSGKVFLVGGEYSGSQGSQNFTNTADMYDPVANTWADANTSTAIPNFPQTQFGDDPSAMLTSTDRRRTSTTHRRTPGTPILCRPRSVAPSPTATASSAPSPTKAMRRIGSSYPTAAS